MNEFMAVPLIVGISFTGIGILLLVILMRAKRDKLSKKYIQIQGEVVNVRNIKSTEGIDLFAPDIKFNLSGQEKIHEVKSYTSGRPPRVGEMIEISVNEQDETDIVVKRHATDMINKVLGLLCGIFTTIGVILLAITFIFR